MSSTVNLRGRHLLGLGDYSREELVYLIDLAAELKTARQDGREQQRLRGKNIALILELDCTRTGCAFRVAAYDQGATVTVIGTAGVQLGRLEAVKDTARVLGRLYDAIAYRGPCEETADTLARHAGVPVYNGLAGDWHSAQVLADFLTFDEHLSKPLEEVAFCYLGDAGTTTAGAYMLSGGKLGMDVRVASPRALWPRRETFDLARAAAAENGGRMFLTDELDEALAGADVLVTDAWVSLDEPAEVWEERIELLFPYQVNSETIRKTGNPGVRFMHCLPALHNTDTEAGRRLHERYGLEALEVTEDVFESAASLVFEGAENRMHMTKAVLVATLER